MGAAQRGAWSRAGCLRGDAFHGGRPDPGRRPVVTRAGRFARSFADSLRVLTLAPFFPGAVLVVTPEHARVFRESGWSKARLRQELSEMPSDGTTVALLDISKPRGDVFLDRLEELFATRGVGVLRFRRPTFARPAPADLRHEISVRCDAVVEALAD